MAFNIEGFKGALKFGGARNSLFTVQLNVPTQIGGSVPESMFLVKAAQIPASTLGTIEVPYFGRQIKIPGNRTFAEWTPTIINDENFTIRDMMENWSARVNGHTGNTNTLGTTQTDYKADAIVTQFGQTGNVLKSYKFVGMFPSEVSTIDLAWETEGIEEFTVTFQYDYWENNAVSTAAVEVLEAIVDNEVQRAILRGTQGVRLGQ